MSHVRRGWSDALTVRRKRGVRCARAVHAAQGRTPLDILSAGLKDFLAERGVDGGGGGGGDPACASEVFSWGNGANYQLGTGAEGLQLTPARLDALHGAPVQALAAAKFHSVALAADGALYTWGFGRGGRLGARPAAHPSPSRGCPWPRLWYLVVTAGVEALHAAQCAPELANSVLMVVARLAADDGQPPLLPARGPWASARAPASGEPCERF